jgi:hypothetical protein
MNKDDIDYETILKLINDIFVKADDDINKSIFENYKIKKIKKINYHLKMHLYIH